MSFESPPRQQKRIPALLRAENVAASGPGQASWGTPRLSPPAASFDPIRPGPRNKPRTPYDEARERICRLTSIGAVVNAGLGLRRWRIEERY